MATPAIAKRRDSRAEDTQNLLADAVIAVVAEVGMSRLTHRRVAAAGGVSLSATTYHYKTKADMLADASQRLLDGYIQRFRAIAQDSRSGARPAFTLAELCTRIVLNAADRERIPTLAWCEIMLDAARSPEGHAIARHWYADLQDAWSEVAQALGQDAAQQRLSCMIDMVVGLLFVTRGLRLDRNEIAAAETGASLETAWRLDSGPDGGISRAAPKSRKSAATRERLLQATIELLVEGGAGAASYAAIAERSGEALTAPAYHFGNISGLLKQAETRMFRESKDRYREVLADSRRGSRSAKALADVTAAIFVREATRFRPETIAHYSIWLEAARDPLLRPDIAASVGDQLAAWQRRLAPVCGGTGHDALACQAMFVGALVRAVSTGAGAETKAGIHGQFRELFGLIATHPKNGTFFQIFLPPGAANA